HIDLNRSRTRRLRVPPRRRGTDPSARALRRVQETRRQVGAPPHPVPGPPHPRNAAAQSRRPYQGGERTARPRNTPLHDGDLPTRPARHATRSRPHSRRDPGTVYRFHPVEQPVERSRPRRSPGPRHALTWASQWRGEDLNLRPSGYEPDELPDCSTPRRAEECTDRL